MLEHSGGGSGVLCGLIAMLAVVGWRSKTRFGDYVKGQMVGLLVFIAIMGMVVPNVGNFEHAGGAVVGAVLGFARHRLFLLNGSRWGRLCGIGSLVLLGLCAGLQARGGADAQTRRQEAAETLARLSARQETIRNVGLLGTLYLSRAISESDESLARDAALGSLIDPVQARRATQRFRQSIQAPVNRVTLLLILNRQVQALSASQSQWLPDEDRDAWEVVEKQIRAAASHRPYPGEIAVFRQAVERIIADLSEAQRRDQRLIQRLQVQINPPKRQPFGKQQGGRELTPP
jgi:hypothetical protein